MIIKHILPVPLDKTVLIEFEDMDNAGTKSFEDITDTDWNAFWVVTTTDDVFESDEVNLYLMDGDNCGSIEDISKYSIVPTKYCRCCGKRMSASRKSKNDTVRYYCGKCCNEYGDMR